MLVYSVVYLSTTPDFVARRKRGGTVTSSPPLAELSIEPTQVKGVVADLSILALLRLLPTLNIYPHNIPPILSFADNCV